MEIGQLRCLRDTRLEIPAGSLWTVVIGENGTGKTSLLRAIADPDHFSTWNYLVSPPAMGRAALFGYGAGRGSRTASLSRLEAHPCATLFDESAALPDPEEWFLRMDYAAAKGDAGATAKLIRVKDALCGRLLPAIEDLQAVAGDRPYLKARTAGNWVPLKDLSYGYQSAMAWIVDLAARLFERYPNSPDPLAEPAVVLVDEIDLHLHPRWQRTLIEMLTSTFEKTQFIVTAHSPLIVQAAPHANLALLRREGDHAVIENDLDYIRNWRVDQILASDLFGHQPVHAPEVEAVMEKRRNLLRKSDLTDAEQAELSALNAQLDALPTAVRPEDQGVLDALRKAAAEMGIPIPS